MLVLRRVAEQGLFIGELSLWVMAFADEKVHLLVNTPPEYEIHQLKAAEDEIPEGLKGVFQEIARKGVYFFEMGENDSFYVKDLSATVKITEVKSEAARIGTEAPAHVNILRSELFI